MFTYKVNLTNLTLKCDKILKCIFLYRFLIGLLLGALLILLEIHGSSIGLYSNILHSPDIVLLGHNRPIRSDEWFVNTPLAFSQYFNDFQYFSEIVRGYSTDMYLMYGQAVKDWPIIFRPFHWGYLLFGPAKGLSFFWINRIIVLFLVSFEFGRIITRDKRHLSFTYAVLITFSPIVQWWFAVNSIAEILIFSQGNVIVCYKYLFSKSIKKKIFLGMIFIWVSIAYVFSLYPAWQIPCAYLFITVLISIFLNNCKQIKFTKNDLFIITTSMIIIIGISISILFKSIDVIQITKDTVYPGTRFCTTGGISFFDMLKYGFNYPLGIWLPLKDITITNNCEIARMFDFAPLGIGLAIAYLLGNNKRDYIILNLIILQCFFLAWCIFIWPAWFAKITLMYNVTNRVILAIGVINIILLIRTISLWDYKIPVWIQFVLSILASIFAIYTVYISGSDVFKYKYYIISALIVSSLWLFTLSRRTKLFCIITIMTVLWSGLGVNPVSKGVASIYDSSLISSIKEINKSNGGKWIVEGNELGIQNLPIMAGAETINSINTYPVLSRWNVLDENGACKNIYNRYAHITINLFNSETNQDNAKFVLNSPDHFTVNMKKDDLKKMDVSYILTKQDLRPFSDSYILFQLLEKDNEFNVFKVNYLR
ncbi:MAG: hypothetical protein SOU02_01210 [Caecibacter massiliensis]|uniref:DUF7657 domain-containing protein n=2 Tax=Negativicutes TaxID=909932 RepID=UPI00260F0C16|nr:hypothetical protein [uncultured Megasphaera sp.]MDY2903543.1 hypothetical protein [Caecibacter massiliensis]